MRKNLFYPLFLLIITTVFSVRPADGNLSNGSEGFECCICNAIKDSSFIGCDFVEQSPYITRVDVSHLLTDRQPDEALFFVVEVNTQHFTEKTESRDVKLPVYNNQQKQMPEVQTVITKIKPGDQTIFSLGLIYNRFSHNRLFEVKICLYGDYRAGDIVSLVNPVTFSNDDVVCNSAETPGIFTRGTRLFASHTNLDSGIQFQKNIVVSKKGLEVDEEEDYEDYDLEEELAEDEEKLEEFLDEMDEQFGKTRFEFLKQFDFSKIDVSKIGIEKLDFKKLVVHEDEKTFSGLENIGIEKIDLSKLDFSQIGLKKYGLRASELIKAISKYFSFEAMLSKKG